MRIDETNLVHSIINTIRAAAEKLQLDDGAVAVCVHDSITRDSFDEIEVAKLSEYGDYCLYRRSGGVMVDHFATVMARMRTAQAAYDLSERRWSEDYVKYYKSSSLDSSDQKFWMDTHGGAVCYPIVEHDYSHCINGGRLAMTITVSVSGGTEKQNSALAWLAEPLIRAHAEKDDCWLDIPKDYGHRNMLQ